jgi:hypothetical protein
MTKGPVLKRLFLLWLTTLIITISFLVYQKMSGPTYPVRYKVEVGGETLKGKFSRSGDINEDLELAITTANENLKADLVWQRFPIKDGWTRVPFIREGGQLKAYLPKQGMAGKLEYRVEISNGGETVVVPPIEAAVARFKGTVPNLILVVHVICMILGMLFSNAAGIDALTGAHQLKILSRLTFGFLLVGGTILGPVVQKYAFDAYWTGWPLGSDWTDNKLAVGALVWLIAMIATWKSNSENKAGRWVTVFAMIVIFVVYGIPHSIHGSTLDYETGEHIQVMLGTLKLCL